MHAYKHGGSLGDVVYSLPSIATIEDPGARVALYLQVDVPDAIPEWAGTRPNVRMSRAEAESLLPLLRAQELIGEAGIYTNQPIDTDLDIWRDAAFDFTKFSIARYYSIAFPSAQPELDLPWLSVTPSDEYKDCAIINRTLRYQANVSYGFLSGRSDVVFLGTGEEYASFSRDCQGVPHIWAENSLQMAEWISGCKLLIGNQSFPFAVAEALKAPRALEVYAQCPNVVPEGPNCVIFFNTMGAEYLIDLLIN